MKKHLKKILFVVTLCFTLVLLCSCTGNWDEAAYLAYECPDPLRLVTAETISDGTVTDVLEDVGLTEEDALSALKDGQVLFTSFLPATDQNAEKKYPVEIFMTVDTSMYVRNVFNYNFLTDEQREELFKQLTEPTAEEEGYEIAETGVTEKNGIHWIRYRYSHTDSVGTQHVAQYTTMYNGFSYTLSAVSTEELDERAIAAMDELLSSVTFTKTLDPVYEYVPRMTFGDTFVRFMKENWLTMLIVAVATVGATAGIMVYHNYSKKRSGRKDDGVVRGEYLR